MFQKNRAMDHDKIFNINAFPSNYYYYYYYFQFIELEP